MKIRITSISSEETSSSLSEAVWIEDCVGPFFLDKEFGGGVAQFTAIFVAVDGDVGENERYGRSADRCGVFKDFRTGDRIKYVGVRVLLNHAEFVYLNKIEARRRMVGALLARLDEPINRVPKDFRIKEFLELFREELLRSL